MRKHLFRYKRMSVAKNVGRIREKKGFESEMFIVITTCLTPAVK